MTNPVDDFLAAEAGELEKTAGLVGFAAKHPLMAQSAAAVATPLVLMGATELYQQLKGMATKARGFKQMMEHNPKLKKMPAEQVKSLYNTLHNVSPTLAKDPVVASSWVNRMAYQEEYTDPKTLSDLATAEQRLTAGRPQLPIGPITSGLMQGVQGEFGTKNQLQAMEAARQLKKKQ